uniref:ATP synthase F0 subunit 8 n=1 Tax=Bactericera cockerelli TaxID=290155 RepID=A0A166GKP9_9HEMI|nr:ATP synthase F0 subunit 8 [Bactericera cockerelli]ANA07527.1 ATP synthase F0 subunit 8 [Bactericera cockerelli]
MPQMAPMPWIFLLMLTLTSLAMVSSIIYFSNQKESMKYASVKKNNFNLKW